MSEKRPRGLLSRLAAPLAEAARRVANIARADRDEEARRQMALALAEAEHAPARLTDETFRLYAEQLAQEDLGAFQIKLHVISLVEFREAVGDKWAKVSEKVMMIAEGVIHAHLGAGNIFCRQGTDFFILIFRTCDNAEGRRRALLIAQELGTRLVGDQFIGSELPLALAAEVPLKDGLLPDGTLNLEAVHTAVSEMRAIIAAQNKDKPQRAWMRGGAAQPGDMGPRRHLMPGAAPADQSAPDDRPLPSVRPEPEAKGPPPDPGWKTLEIEPRDTRQPTWIILDGAAGERVAPGWAAQPAPWDKPMPADARLSLVWRPTWVAAGEVIGAYEARIQRVDAAGQPALEGTHAYPQHDEPAAHTLDRFRIANAIRDLRASEAAGNAAMVIIPIHWLTIASESRMDFLAPFADITPGARTSRVVIKLFGVPAGIEPTLLRAAIARARELCRMVMLRTRLSDPQAAMALDCGAAMIGADLAELAGRPPIDDDQLLAALTTFQAQAAKSRLGCYVLGVRRRKVIVGAVHAGFAMVNGPALMKDIPKPARQLPAPRSRFTLS